MTIPISHELWPDSTNYLDMPAGLITNRGVLVLPCKLITDGMVITRDDILKGLAGKQYNISGMTGMVMTNRDEDGYYRFSFRTWRPHQCDKCGRTS